MKAPESAFPNIEDCLLVCEDVCTYGDEVYYCDLSRTSARDTLRVVIIVASVISILLLVTFATLFWFHMHYRRRVHAKSVSLVAEPELRLAYDNVSGGF